jgi:glycosyltransferase involved in cell wall biosynthesis
MRIVITSAPFHPSLGGIETATHVLASGLIERDHHVTVVTPTPGDCDGYPFKVVRNPKPMEYVRLVRDCDLMWQSHVSLRLLWPLVFAPRPLIIMHHIWLRSDAETETKNGFLKRFSCLFAQNVFVSSILRDAARLSGPVIPNSYDEMLFRELPDVPRDRDVVYLGRLKAFKGPDLVIDAIARLAASGKRLTATVIGMGPQADALKEQAAAASIAAQVDFPGPLQGEALVRAINRHRIMVVPSRWEEPFGLVALEGMACGCVVVVANSGGLPEVVGPCGPVVPKNDPAALAAELDRLVSHPEVVARYRQGVLRHLAKFRTATMLDACEAAIRQAVSHWRQKPISPHAAIASTPRRQP